eukprot:1140579-Pelagomonas_calceolata.AAC.3
MRIWRVSGSTQLQNLAMRRMIVFNSMPSGNKLVGVHNRMGMKFASKFNGTSMVKSKLLKLIKGVLSITSPTDAQENNMKSHSFCTNEFSEVCMLPLCCLQLLSRPRVLTNSWCEQEEEGEEEVGLASQGAVSVAEGRLNVRLDLLKQLETMERGCTVPIYHHSYVRVNQACFLRAFAKSFDDHSSSNVVAFSFHVGIDMSLEACEHVECAIYLITA